ncbi:aminotransferase class V-fold PLP-dependent enzyme [Paradesulfitobacterium ferrireducens]|uniref:aminotransferase class V-fold PLP-dependent enzyme n=1 Tax=Paradesulfitobacterium ferrireducens TaxID=2816476 RepID=UPI001A8FAF4B|nr:aminotransferase class V-fold PLP-dependent enzyme [Paradesulfitobacterium ferrireducens]
MIYLDNAATTWPKPTGVQQAMLEALNLGGNAGRGGHAASLKAQRLVHQVREDLCRFFGTDDPTQVIFTHNATHALNQALFGLLQPGDHVITSSLEHNAVTRPLKVLADQGVEVTEIMVHPDQEFPWAELDQAFQGNTKLVVTVHASNVTGTLLPVEQIGRIAHRHGALYLLDASQTAGVFPLDLGQLPVDLLAFPGHKGLLGPQGTGGLIVKSKVKPLKPLLYGGTGSVSESDEQPDFLPDALESGTLNVVGIAGLGAAMSYLKAQGLKQIQEREQALCQRLIDGLKEIPHLILYGGFRASSKASIVSFNIGDLDSTFVAYTLEQTAGIVARAGLHCAPHAHKTLGTLEQGTVRFSPSHFTTEAEIDRTLEAVKTVARDLV